MKKASIFLLALVTLATGSFARDDYSINKITANFVHTPQYSFSGDVRSSPPQQLWMEIEVEFKSYVEYTDELTFKYYIYFEKKCLTGTVTHVDVPKGLNLLSVMYISPRTLARLSGGKASKTVDEATVQIFYKGQLVAQKSLKSTPGEWWLKTDQVPGYVLNKNETPFAPLYWDRYESIKSEAHQ